MAYKNNRRYRRRFNRRYFKRNSFRKRSSFKRKVMKVLGVEKKTFFVTVADTTVTTTPLIVSLDFIAQGVGKFQRIGNKISVRYIKLRFTVSSASAANNVFRWAVLQWRGAPQNPVAADLPAGQFDQFIPVEKWHIYRDMRTVLADTQVNTDTNTKFFTLTVPIFKEHTYFDNGTQANKPFYFCIWSNDVITPSPHFSMNAVLTYTDI